MHNVLIQKKNVCLESHDPLYTHSHTIIIFSNEHEQPKYIPCSRTENVNVSPSSPLLQDIIVTLVLWNTLDVLVTCSVPSVKTSPISVDIVTVSLDHCGSSI